MTEKAAYKLALEELQSGATCQGVWIKAMAFSEGDEKKAKANYLKFRAEQLLKVEPAEVAKKMAGSIGRGFFRLFLSPRGKMSRPIFLAVVVCGWAAVAVAIQVGKSQTYGDGTELVSVLFSLGLGFVAAWSVFAAHMKRWRDTGEPSTAVVVVVSVFGVLPLINFLVTLLLLAVGTDGHRPSGAMPQKEV